MFKKVDSKVDLVKLEEKVLKFWKKQKIFEKTLKKTEKGKKFVFYEGPPTANGVPGVHHILSRVYKDIFPRFKTMKGYNVSRKAGWDTHGLPVELEIEKKLGINSKDEIEDIGIEKFNRLCRESVMKYEEDWKKLTERIGFWLDMDNAYFTFKDDYIETIWWILKNIWDKDLLYEGHKIVPYCPRCGTPLSSHEIAQGYKDVEDYSIIAKFALRDKKNTYLLVWTTTPWTLVSNAGAAVNGGHTYIEVEYNDERLILVKDLIDEVFGEEKPYKVITEHKGSDLVSMAYEPVYDYAEGNEKAFHIVGGDFVSTRDGTGIVHIAPAFGEDDMRVGKQNGLPVIQMVDLKGLFLDRVDKFANMAIEDANPIIIEDLKKRGLLFEVKKFKHSYPFCWRCDTKLIYYAKKSWYIATSKIKDKLLAANEDIKWYPDHIQHGRFGKWLENNIDWALTRERYWGTPLPIWEDENGHKVCIGSRQELEKLGKDISPDLDLHRPFVDNAVIRCPQCGCDMHRVKDVIDVWFDSGSMPFAQHHYPFENKETFKENFPADFICEAIDQTRGWFYTMLAISTILTGRSSFKNVLVLGLINDKNGQKMSKSKGNVVKPWDILDRQGADALRWYFFTGVSPWLPKNFSVKSIDEVIRKFILTLWNTYSFFVIYANIDSFDPDSHELAAPDRMEIDRWIISELNRTVKEVNIFLEDFNVTESGRLIQDFVDMLSNWYVRRSRRRFWKSEEDKDKISAYLTLYECLLTVTKLCAPYIPFISEDIYRNLAAGTRSEKPSVHLEDYPEADLSLIDEDLSFKMNTARKIVGLGRAVRSKINIKTRQPIEKVAIYFEGDGKRKDAISHFENIILSELNTKGIEFISKLDDLVEYDIKPNLILVGKKYGPMIPAIKIALSRANQAQIALKVKNEKNIKLDIDGSTIELEPGEILVQIKNRDDMGVETDGEFTVGLPIKISDELLAEGFARELVHHIQNLRKDAGFEIENTIDMAIEAPQTEKAVIDDYRDYIMKETLSNKIGDGFSDDMYIKDIKVNKVELKIGIKVAGSII
ncbi:MAG TPA: isoleucine--tRNA ligase [Actinobacteria bacterium]|nr:isoleucine--tRNA ligase [Actinomycetota bacterium]